jgi:E3 ubiquitin-protein ligase SHPRH
MLEPNVHKIFWMRQVEEAAASRSTEERIECVCSVTSETPGAEDYDGLWVQCERCNAWLHGHCAGFKKRAPKGVSPSIPSTSCNLLSPRQ